MYCLVVFLLYLLAIAFGDHIPKRKSHSNFRPDFPSGKIVGGVETPIEDVPYQVSIQRGGKHHCGGSIIGTRQILSAGHCFSHHFNASEYIVRTGSSELQSGGTVMKVKSYKVHPKFDRPTIDYDVSVVELEEDIQLNPGSAIITLAETEAVNGYVLVSGWGDGPAIPNTLYSVVVTIINCTECQKVYDGTKWKITARMICAGDGGKGHCFGDSGGPLVIGKGVMRIQLGIASWRSACAESKYPGGFTNIANPEIRSFIKEHTGI